MKKSIRKYAFVLTCCSLFFCACNKQTESENVGNVTEPEFAEKNVTGIAQLQLGDDGVLYGINEEGTQIAPYYVETGAFGTPLVDTIGIQSFCYGQGNIYYIAINQLYQVDIASGKITELACFNGVEFYFGKMVVVGEQVFIIRRNSTDALWVYDLAEAVLEVVSNDCVEAIAEKNGDELLIYAHDEENIPYIMSYHVQDKMFSEKRYMEDCIYEVTDITYDESRKMVLLLNYQGIWALPEETLSGAALAYDSEGQRLFSLQCKEGNTYALNRGESGKVISIENSTINLEIPILKAYTLSEFSNTPNLGFQIQFEEITAKELTLSILAGDMDFDFLLINSQWDLGYHISRIGAYSTMNDIPGVEDFLKECHEFAENAAKTEDGTIWMLPYQVEGAVLCYNETLFREMGLTLSDIDTVEETYNLAGKVISDGSAYIDLPVALLATDMLNKYHANYGIQNGYAHYDTEQFRKIADIRKQYEMRAYDGTINYNTFHSAYPKGKPTDEQISAVLEKTLFSIERIENLQSTIGDKSQYDFFHVAPLPDLEEGVNLKDEVEIAFLVINPNSEKLSWVRKYVEKLCEELRADEESFLLEENAFPENTMYKETAKILSNAQVTFLTPTSMVSDAMYSFLFEEQNLEDSIEEIERIMNMYMHE